MDLRLSEDDIAFRGEVRAFVRNNLPASIRERTAPGRQLAKDDCLRRTRVPFAKGRTLLLTAFEPFGGEAVNASWEAARRLVGRRLGDAAISTLMLPCAYDRCVAEFIVVFERLRPAALLLTGQAARRGIVSVERFARNHVRGTARDASGAFGAAAHEGPDLLEATASPPAIARAIRKAGVAAHISRNAGGYVCNHFYYRVLQHLSDASPATPAIFVHLPPTPEQSPPKASAQRLAAADAARALQAAAQALLMEIAHN